MKATKKFWIIIVILALLSPLGLILPGLFHAGRAWGEWSVEELKKLAGFVPAGMERLSRAWNPPLPDYSVPGQHPGMVHQSLGYVLTALIGLIVTAACAYVVAKLLSRRR